MKAFSALLALCEGNPPVTSQRPVTRSTDFFFFHLRTNKGLSNQTRRRWFETPSRSLWCHCNRNNLVIWHHLIPSQDWPQRQTACFCVRISKGPQNQSQNWDHTLWWILPRGRCSNWWCPCCDMLRSEDQWAALMYCEGHLQSTVCGWTRNLFSWVLPRHHRETFTAGS